MLNHISFNPLKISFGSSKTPPNGQLENGKCIFNLPLQIDTTDFRYKNFSNINSMALDLLGSNNVIDFNKFKAKNSCKLLDLLGVTLVNKDLPKVNLKWSDLSDSDLTSTNFEGANLEWVDLDGAKLENVNLIGAELNEVSATLDELKKITPESKEYIKANYKLLDMNDGIVYIKPKSYKTSMTEVSLD